MTSSSFVSHESDTLVAVRVESPASRVRRVFDALHGNGHARNSHSQNSPARSLHGLHDARCVENSQNSVGEGAARGRGVCVPGETKSPSMSSLCQVWRPAVKELAQTQQASRKLHVETWAGLLQGPGLRISLEVEIAQGCAVTVARSSCPVYSPVSPWRGRVVRNMLGWSQMEKTNEFGGYGSLSAAGGRLGKERIVPHSVVGSL